MPMGSSIASMQSIGHAGGTRDLGNINVLQNVMAICPVVVEIFQS